MAVVEEVEEEDVVVETVEVDHMVGVDHPLNLLVAAMGMEMLLVQTRLIIRIKVELQVVDLPARGRTILGFKVIDIVLNGIPSLIQRSLVYKALDRTKLRPFKINVGYEIN